ncbi:50S ribosomal protein L19 [Lyngbya sp. PCC 8106]|nr:50S ribosomal protein L19 [Lyngbya sp. PCC 8106]
MLYAISEQVTQTNFTPPGYQDCSARPEGLEPSTSGFGDLRSTN